MTTPGRAPRAARGLVAVAAGLAVITLAARVLGFGRWLVFSATVGSSCVGSAYATANTVPNVLFEVVAGGALAASVVPVLTTFLVREDRASADRTASALLGWVVVLLVPLAVVVALLARPISSALLDRPACPGQVDAAAWMLLWFAPQVVLYGIGVVLTGVLQAHRRFYGPALAPLVSSLVVVVVYLLFATGTARPGGAASQTWLPDRPAQTLLAVGTTAGVLALSLPLLLPVHRAGVRLRPTLRLPPGVAGRVGRLAWAGVAGLLAQEVLLVVTVRLANASGGAGAVNVYTYAQAVYLLPYAVLAVPLATAAFPTLSSQAARDDGPGYAATLSRSTRLVLLVAIAGAAVLVAVAPAVGLLFTAADVGGAALGALPLALTAYAPGLVGYALIAHLGRALFAAGAASWAARSTVAGWLAAVVVSLVLVPALTGDAADPSGTLLGLGVASSIGMTVAGVLLLAGAARLRVGDVRVAGELVSSLRVLVRALLVAVVALVVGRLVTDQVADLPAGNLAGALVGGLVGTLATLAVLVGGLALTDRQDLVALLRRGARAAAPAAADQEDAR